MCGNVGRGVWLHAGGIASANIICVIGQYLLISQRMATQDGDSPVITRSRSCVSDTYISLALSPKRRGKYPLKGVLNNAPIYLFLAPDLHKCDKIQSGCMNKNVMSWEYGATYVWTYA